MEAHARREGRGLALGFSLGGDVSRLRLPAYEGTRRGDRLWETSCFEVFAAQEGAAGYVEFNFAPSGAWAAYRFSGYRQGMIPVLESPPKIWVRRAPGLLELSARLAPATLPNGDRLHLALCAVIEDLHGGRSFWALHHEEGKPDFHRRETFTLVLDMTDGEPGTRSREGWA